MILYSNTHGGTSNIKLYTNNKFLNTETQEPINIEDYIEENKFNDMKFMYDINNNLIETEEDFIIYQLQN